VFQFNAEEGFMIKNGELKEAIKDVSLSGEILRILHEVDAVGKDFDLYIGFCGKDSQVVPVGDGGPHIRTFATVGGTT
jgi:TldD protein